MPGNDAVVAEFTRQARTFTADGWASRGLHWIVGLIEPEHGSLVLDVAAGAAHLGRALAPRVRHVSAVDVTGPLLARGQRDAGTEGHTNITFQLGDATALPFLSGSFDLVVCRLALHHFEHPDDAIAEMVRVCRSGGRVVLVDMIASGQHRRDAERDRLERLRDPTHQVTWTVRQIRDALERHQVHVEVLEEAAHPVELEGWLDRTSTSERSAEEIRGRLEAEMTGAADPTGLQPVRHDEQVWLTHVWAVVGGRVP